RQPLCPLSYGDVTEGQSTHGCTGCETLGIGTQALPRAPGGLQSPGAAQVPAPMRRRMRRAATAFALALVLLGCGSVVPTGEPVQLLTGAMPFDADECSSDFYVASELLVDAEYGTALAS